MAGTWALSPRETVFSCRAAVAVVVLVVLAKTKPSTQLPSEPKTLVGEAIARVMRNLPQTKGDGAEQLGSWGCLQMC